MATENLIRTQDERKAMLELSEHDALQLLALIEKETDQVDEIWRPYWERLAQNIRQSIESVSFSSPPERTDR